MCLLVAEGDCFLSSAPTFNNNYYLLITIIINPSQTYQETLPLTKTPKTPKTLCIFVRWPTHCRSHSPIFPKCPCSRLQYLPDSSTMSYISPSKERALRIADSISRTHMVRLDISHHCFENDSPCLLSSRSLLPLYFLLVSSLPPKFSPIYRYLRELSIVLHMQWVGSQ